MIPFPQNAPPLPGPPADAWHVLPLETKEGANPWKSRPKHDTAPLPPVSLPADELPHEYRTEWWYFVTHLQVEGTQRKLSLVWIVLQEKRPRTPPAVLGIVHYVDHELGMQAPVANAQLMDMTFERLQAPELFSFDFDPSRGPASRLASWSLSGGDGYYTIRMERPYQLDLQLKPGVAGGRRSKPVVLGDDGVVDMGHDRALAYYLWTNIEVRGSIETDGGRREVTGHGWLDRQWGPPPVRAMYWKYLAIHLESNNEQWMFFHLAHTDLPGKPDFLFGVHIDGLSRVTHYHDVEIVDSHEVKGYRIDSTIKVPSAKLELDVRPIFEEQEIVPKILWTRIPRAPRWFEGVSQVSGTIDGGAVHGLAMTEIYDPELQ